MRTMLTRRFGPVLVLLLGVVASSSLEAQGRRDRNRITEQEIAEASASTVWDLVQTRRAMWLPRDQRPTFGGEKASIVVFLDGAQLDGVGDLKQVSTTGVRLVEFLNAGQTRYRLGRYSPNGAIVIYQATAPPEQAEDGARAAR